MTSGGITKKRMSFGAAIAFFAAAIYLANEATNPVWAVLPFAFGLISFAGVWANGLPKSEDPDDAELMDAIK